MEANIVIIDINRSRQEISVWVPEGFKEMNISEQVMELASRNYFFDLKRNTCYYTRNLIGWELLDCQDVKWK